MKIYRFSPIKNRKEFMEAINYIVSQTLGMCKKIIGKPLPVSSLTVFSHYADEYHRLIKILQKMGDQCAENNGIYFSLRKPMKRGRNSIKYIRIRLPDPYRMQVGCNDFDIEDYGDFKNTHLKKHAKNLRLVKRPGYEMIEFFDPDFDVLAYVVSPEMVFK